MLLNANEITIKARHLRHGEPLITAPSGAWVTAACSLVPQVRRLQEDSDRASVSGPGPNRGRGPPAWLKPEPRRRVGLPGVAPVARTRVLALLP